MACQLFASHQQLASTERDETILMDMDTWGSYKREGRKPSASLPVFHWYCREGTLLPPAPQQQPSLPPRMINISSAAFLALVLVLLQKDATALQIVHGQGRKSHYNTTQPSRYQPLELKSLGGMGSSQYQLRHNLKYDFWFFTNPRFNGPHTDSMLNSEGNA